MKKICFVVSNAISADSFLTKHIQYLRKKYKVTLITNSKSLNKDRYKSIHIHNINFERKTNIINDLTSLFKLLFLLKKKKYDLIISLTPKVGFLVSLISFIIKIKYIHYFTGQHWINKNCLAKTLYKFIDKTIGYRSKISLCDSNTQRDFIIKNKIINQYKIKVLGNGSICGVDTNYFKRDVLKRKRFRKKLKIYNNNLVLLYVGRITKEKGIENLINCFKKINNKKITLILVGPIEGNFNINQETINNNILLYPNYQNPTKFYNIADIYINPSYREGFGVSVIEASSYELPVICSNIYGLKNAYQNGVTGLSFKVGNEKLLKKSIIFLTRNKNKRIQMGKSGRAYVKKFYEQKIVIKNFYDFLSTF